MKKTEFVYKAFISYTARDAQFVRQLTLFRGRGTCRGRLEKKFK